jgi:hypothetical protein
MPRSTFSRDFITSLRAHQARVSITPSTVRAQGKGTMHVARDFIASELDLAKLRVSSERRYLAQLDKATDALRRHLKGKAKSWGLARKLLNIYIRDCVYSRMLCAHYRLERIEPFLELPLDGVVGQALGTAAIARGQHHRLPRWKSIRRLTPEQSALYQGFATELVAEAGHARVHLDVVIWGGR